MGLLTRAIAERRETIANPSRWLTLAFGGGQQTASGILVNEAIALRSTTVMACVRIISETIAQVPLVVYKRTAGGKDRAPDHPLYPVLHDRANSEMTAFELREVMQAHLLTWGNAYAEIERDNANRIVGLWPMLPDRTWPYRDPITGKIAYRTRIKRDPMSVSVDDTVTIQLPEEKVLHIKGLGFDGLKGYSVIGYARELIAEDLALQEFAGRFFGNGAVPGGVLKTDKRLSKEQHDRLRISWQDQHQGLSNAQRIAILEEGLTWESIGIPLKDAQWIDARNHVRNLITSLFRIPPHMVGDVERSTSWGKGIEQQAIGFLVYTIQPWALRWEQGMLSKLFTPAEQKIYFPEFLVDGLVRGDIETRTAAYTAGRNGGWLSANEIRDKENMNRIPGGDVYLVPLNMVPSTEAGDVVKGPGGEPQAAPQKSPGPTPPRAGPSSKKRPTEDPADNQPSVASLVTTVEMRAGLMKAQRHVFAEVFERAGRREKADIVRGLDRRSVEDGARFVRDFYESHREYVQRALLPPLLGLTEGLVSLVSSEIGREVVPTAELWKFVRSYGESAAERYCSQALKEMRALSPDALVSALDTRVSRASQIAAAEAVKSGNALLLAIYKDAGEKRKRWIALDRDPQCLALDNRALPMMERFGDVQHPPLHEGCTCVIVRQGVPSPAPSGSVILMRHGQTDHNIPPERYRGHKDVPLTEEGKRQSRELAEHIVDRYPVDEINASDLRRAAYLGEQIREKSGAPLFLQRGLRPWDIGDLSGKNVGDGSDMQHYVDHPNEKVPGGESLNDFLDRYSSFIRPKMDEAAKNGKSVAIVTHTRNIRALLGSLRSDSSQMLDAASLLDDDPLGPADHMQLVWDGTKWVEQDPDEEKNDAPNPPTGGMGVMGSSLKQVQGPGSLGQPVQGFHPRPINAAQA